MAIFPRLRGWSVLMGAALLFAPSLAGADSPILLEKASVAKGIAIEGQKNSFAAILRSEEKAAVIVDVELYDLSHRRLGQKIWSASFAPGESRTFQADVPGDLRPGTYYYSVGVFSPGWELLNWHHRTANFTVYEKSPCGGDCQVVTVSSAQRVREVRAEGRNSLTVVLRSPNTANTVLVDLELYDAASNEKVHQKFWNSQRLSPDKPLSYSAESPVLPPGEYYWSLGIFYPHWTGLSRWEHAVQRFTVRP